MELSETFARIAAAALEYYRALEARLVSMTRQFLESLPIPTQGALLPVLETAVEFGAASVVRGPAQGTLAILSQHYRRPVAPAVRRHGTADAGPEKPLQRQDHGADNTRPPSSQEDSKNMLRRLHRLRSP